MPTLSDGQFFLSCFENRQTQRHCRNSCHNLHGSLFSKKMGYVREELEPDMFAGLMIDRIFSQVMLAPWIKKKFDTDLLTDAKYRRKWCDASIDILKNGVSN
jgi:hypothetical protein